MVTDILLDGMVLAVDGLVLRPACLALRSGRVVPGKFRAEVRCLVGGFAAMCLAVDLTTHWANRMDALRLFVPI